MKMFEMCLTKIKWFVLPVCKALTRKRKQSSGTVHHQDRLLADLEASTSQFKSAKPGPPPPLTSNNSNSSTAPPPAQHEIQSPVSPIYSEIPANVNGNDRFSQQQLQSEPLYEEQPDRRLPPGQDPSHLYAKPHQGFSQRSPAYNSSYQPQATTNQQVNNAPPPKPARIRPAPQPTNTAYQFPETTGYNNKTYQETKMDNLSELDSLLADLESAQVKIQNATSPKPYTPPSPTKGPPPATAPKPRRTDGGPASPTGVAPGYQYSQPPLPESPQLHISQPPTRTASSATKELDDLMASLSDFQISSAHPAPAAVSVTNEPSYAKPHQIVTHPNPVQTTQGNQAPPRGIQLDSMLGHLESDVSRQGVSTVAKGFCGACQKQIVGQIVTALGQTWHPEHFVCSHCQVELGTKSFFEREGQAFCETDYQNLFSPRCAYCNGPILDKCVTALDKTWHPEHFFCAQCGQPFNEGGFHEKNGKVYCKEDYFDMFAPKCGGCHRAIMENYITALNVQWHPECFVCGECRMPFNGGSFFDHDSIPYCEIHYHAVRGSLCAGCCKPITGRCITAMQKKFHPEHFICAFCLKQLNKGTFKEQNDKPYCHACFIKLFS
ncbi:paxillin-like isoform X2 [Asterias rubens]|uniref:paxillin-like isoform X2 n=1 Tax=Asterias rubens TaxID=7604 RepID=UPI001454F64F|nr:paxillin-like isoform X2 [Asterias rubens]